MASDVIIINIDVRNTVSKLSDIMSHHLDNRLPI